MCLGKFGYVATLLMCVGAGYAWMLSESAQTENAQTEERGKSSPESIENGQLRAGSETLPLGAFLDRISQGSGITLHRGGKIPDGISVSSHLLSLPVHEALLKALAGFNVLMGYSPSTAHGAGRLTDIWIYPREYAVADIVKDSVSTLSTQHNAVALAGAEEIVEVIARGDGAAGQAITQALQDSDEVLRHRVLVAASEGGSLVPSDTLIQIVQTDPSEIVRGAALTALRRDPTTDDAKFRVLLDWATADPSSHVRSIALDLLSGLDHDNQAPNEDGLR